MPSTENEGPTGIHRNNVNTQSREQLSQNGRSLVNKSKANIFSQGGILLYIYIYIFIYIYIYAGQSYLHKS